MNSEVVSPESEQDERAERKAERRSAPPRLLDDKTPELAGLRAELRQLQAAYEGEYDADAGIERLRARLAKDD